MHSRTKMRQLRQSPRFIKVKGPQAADVKRAVDESKARVAKRVGEPKWYDADPVRRPLTSRKQHHKLTKLRASITPGTVLIVLSGRFRGKRVIFLKQLPKSGLLLVTGPFKINGVPLRRMNQAYVIATTTKVDVTGTDVSKIDDAFFQRAKKAAVKKDADAFFAQDKKVANVIAAPRKDAQKNVDSVLLKTIEKVPNLKAYLTARFTLTNGQAPHTLKF